MPNIFDQAEKELNNFIQKDILSYSKNRNYDYGPERRSNVSVLSKYISHRVINEYDVIGSALSSYPLSKIEKYIQEVFWRIYWKGWLEHRPMVWSDYLSYTYSDNNNADYNNAIEGNTGIACFDSWVAELKDKNYLHNHTRMWFASIWIFTLNLPWQLGANFFMRHLFDGDSASNTLSWRWVAGLQTVGKHYLATSSNISKYTNNKFEPKNLNEDASPLTDNKIYNVKDINYTNTEQSSDSLIMFDNDLSLKDSEHLLGKYKYIYLIHLPNESRCIKLSDNVINFKYAILKDFSDIYTNSEIFNGGDIKKVIDANQNIDVIYPCIGENLSFLEKHNDDKKLNYIYRYEDLFCWKYAKKGFFNFKKNIPLIIERVIKSKDLFNY
ncbi:FAD-binding domain-containing protein [Gammaproteobacteria bacterium]|nr:FAD-binding domain-containing protein [Gammaproteobacteria bacterium]